MIFLECSTDVLIQRFSETRRYHPLSGSGSVREGIMLERKMLEEIRLLSDRHIDTSKMNVHQLRNLFQEYFENCSRQDMLVTFLSFGFRYGIPSHADLVLDVRFLPNPYFVDELRHGTGLDRKVSDFVLRSGDAQRFLDHVQRLFDFLLPRYEAEGKVYLTVAIGCTGGRHRSVAVAEELTRRLRRERAVKIRHRDIGK